MNKKKSMRRKKTTSRKSLSLVAPTTNSSGMRMMLINEDNEGIYLSFEHAFRFGGSPQRKKKKSIWTPVFFLFYVFIAMIHF
jgi:hypothetical protein